MRAYMVEVDGDRFTLWGKSIKDMRDFAVNIWRGRRVSVSCQK